MLKNLHILVFVILSPVLCFAQNTVTISEINYNSEASADPGNWVELYNFGSASVNIGGWLIKDNNNANVYVLPANTTLASQERWLVSEDLALFNSVFPTITNVSGPLGFGLGNKTDMVRLFNAQNQLLVSVTYYDSIPWPQGADGEGRTLELLDPMGNMNDPANWFDGCIGGSPGAAYTPCNDAIIFSEINCNSDSLHDTDDWVELRNVSDQPIDIGGWKFMDDTVGAAHTYVIPSPRVIQPHSNWVLVQTLTKFVPLNPTVSNMEGPFNFNLNGKGEWIRMYDNTNKLRLSVHYDNKLPWPDVQGNTYTLEIIDSLGKMNNGTNWQTICPGGSPGRYPSLPCLPLSGIYSPELSGVEMSVSPNPSVGAATLTLAVNQPEILSVVIRDIAGKEVEIAANTLYVDRFTTLEIGNPTLPSGIYLVECRGEGGIKVIKWVKQ